MTGVQTYALPIWLRAAEDAGALAVRLIENPILPSQIITAASVENALRVLLALGGSTNALIHLTAVAGRRGVKIDLHRLNELSDSTPVLVDLKPTGQGYMEDFHAAGGMPSLLWELRDLLHLDCIDVTGAPLGERLREPAFVDRRYIRARGDQDRREHDAHRASGSAHAPLRKRHAILLR